MDIGTGGSNSKYMNGYNHSNDGDDEKPYEEIMGFSIQSSGENDEACGGGIASLSSRLKAFREWLVNDARATIHPSLCIVNGESTDGTKGAPVLTLIRDAPISCGNAPASNIAINSGRCGMIDSELDRQLYDRTLGCQLRAVNQIKEGAVIMSIPKTSMITPDIIAASDAGQCLYECISGSGNNKSSCGSAISNFWNVFENTTISENRYKEKMQRNIGTQLLIKILQERKKAETAISKSLQKMQQNKENDGTNRFRDKFIQPDTVSTRAPILLFLIQQRFSNCVNPPIVKNSRDSTIPTNTPLSFAPYVRTLPSTVTLPICWKRNELAVLAGCISGLSPLLEVASQTSCLVNEFISITDAGIATGERHPNIFPPGLITWERYIWAFSLYTSRVLPVSCFLNGGQDYAIIDMMNENYSNSSNSNNIIMQSPSDIWNELGVMVPLLDMLNHDSESSQVTWEPNVPENKKKRIKNEDNYDEEEETKLDDNDNEESVEPHPPRAILHKKVKKSCQICTNYGSNKSNHDLILRYGFAQLSNPADEVKMGWGLTDSVGGGKSVKAPPDYVCILDDIISNDKAKNLLVYDSVDPEAVNIWWSDSRLTILEKEALVSDNNMAMLKMGKKLQSLAFSDGTIHPVFLSSAVVGTMPPEDVDRYTTKNSSESSSIGSGGVALTRTHQYILRQYLAFIFTRKLEKLLQNLKNGLKDHFSLSHIQLWTKASQGGLQYVSKSDDNDAPGEATSAELNKDENNRKYIGWQSFFDMHAYNATLESEEGNVYYAVGPDSCVLTLYDGHLRCLQASIDALKTKDAFEKNILKQLKDLNYIILEEEDGGEDEEDGEEEEEKTENERIPATITGIEQDNNINWPSNSNLDHPSAASTNDNHKQTTAESDVHPQKGLGEKKEGKKEVESGSGGGGKENSGGEKNSGSGNSRRCNRYRKGGSGGAANDRPPAIKLHIGNLSYQTKPADLYEFFADLYGRENVLECHIPTERETGKSRGFGFVTMPEAISLRALNSGRKHEIDGRLLKVAQSNSAGSSARGSNRGGGGGGSAQGPAAVPSDRCSSCGYRPKYCSCSRPIFNGSNGIGCGGMMFGHQPFPLDDPMSMDNLDYGGGGVYGYGPRKSSYNYDYEYYGSGSSRRHRSSLSSSRRSYSRSESPPQRGSDSRSGGGVGGDDGYNGGGRSGGARDHGYRDYRDGHSKSRSYSCERDVDSRDRSRRVRKDRSSRDRSGDSGRRSGNSRWDGEWSSRGHCWSSDGSRSYSPTGRAGRRGASLSGSVSPPQSRSSANKRDRNRSGDDRQNRRRRSRSRSRCSRSERRKRRRRERSRSRSRTDSHSLSDPNDV